MPCCILPNLCNFEYLRLFEKRLTGHCATSRRSSYYSKYQVTFILLSHTFCKTVIKLIYGSILKTLLLLIAINSVLSLL